MFEQQRSMMLDIFCSYFLDKRNIPICLWHKKKPSADSRLRSDNREIAFTLLTESTDNLPETFICRKANISTQLSKWSQCSKNYLFSPALFHWVDWWAICWNQILTWLCVGSTSSVHALNTNKTSTYEDFSGGFIRDEKEHLHPIRNVGEAWSAASDV